jgi:hypothetical protein
MPFSLLHLALLSNFLTSSSGTPAARKAARTLSFVWSGKNQRIGGWPVEDRGMNSSGTSMAKIIDSIRPQGPSLAAAHSWGSGSVDVATSAELSLSTAGAADRLDAVFRDATTKTTTIQGKMIATANSRMIHREKTK